MALAPDDERLKKGPRARLRRRIDRWTEIRDQIRELLRDTVMTPDQKEQAVAKLREQRAGIVDDIAGIVNRHPSLRDDAIDLGFRADLLPVPEQVNEGERDRERIEAEKGQTEKPTEPKEPEDPTAQERRDRRAAREAETKSKLQTQAQDNRLLGDKGKQYDLVQGPKGSYVVRYKFRIGGEVLQAGLRISSDELTKYGFKESDAKSLTAAQMKRIKNIGRVSWVVPHVRKGDKHMFQALARRLEWQYEGQSLLKDDSVMAVIIANSMFGWNPGEFENQLRQTKWYKNTNPYQRDWALVTSRKQKKDTVNLMLERVTNQLEDSYGLDWIKHVEGGLGKAREWAEKIASGQFGEPGTGFEVWADRQFDKAAKIEGTNAWLQQQQEAEQRRKLLNRPEDMFERIRSEALSYLGYAADETPFLSRATLQGVANDLVSGVMSEGDWQKMLRQQMKAMYPHFDLNVPWQAQVDPYKAMLEQTIGTTVSWADSSLTDLMASDAEGKPIKDAPMSLYDYGQWIRDNDPRFWENPNTEERGRRFAQNVQQLMVGGA